MDITTEERVTTTTTEVVTTVKTTTIAYPTHPAVQAGTPPVPAITAIPLEPINPIKSALAGVPCSSYFLHADKVVTIQSREKIPAAVQTLVDFGISAAPVLDDTARCIGLFDMADVLDFVLKVFEETKPLGDNFLTQLEQNTRMCIEPCVTIAGASKRDQYHPVLEDALLIDAITLLDTHNLHRVPVIDNTEQITSLITQSGVLQWFAYNLDKLGPIIYKSVQDLFLGFQPVVMVNGNEPAIEAFQLMDKKGISSVAVVDNSLKLLTVVSTSDLKTVTKDPALISRLHLPVLSYLALLNPEGSRPPVVCAVTDTVEHVIRTLVTKKIHRVYLVDSPNLPPQNQQPVGVITLRDVIHILLQDYLG